jgi:hypothetical protein
MNSSSKFLSLLLIVALLMATSAMSGWAEVDRMSASSKAGEPTASCHDHSDKEHGGKNPHSSFPGKSRSTPVNYRCCLAGHDIAVIHPSDTVQPAAQCSHASLQPKPALVTRFQSALANSKGLFVDPPGTTPLRI